MIRYGTFAQVKDVAGCLVLSKFYPDAIGIVVSQPFDSRGGRCNLIRIFWCPITTPEGHFLGNLDNCIYYRETVDAYLTFIDTTTTNEATSK